MELSHTIMSPTAESFSSDERQHLLVNIEDGHNNVKQGENKIEIRKLSRVTDKGVVILDGVDLDIPKGMIIGVIGPSGSGKSTLLRALNRLWEPPAGTVFLDGRDVCDLDVLAVRRRVGMLFQLPALFDEPMVYKNWVRKSHVSENVKKVLRLLTAINVAYNWKGTVADNIRYGPKLRGKKLSDEEVLKLLSLADMDASFINKKGNELSVGQQQRVALARTLANEPEVLLLDEPTSALDPISTQNIEDALVKLKTAQGMTVIMVSHSIRQVQRIADLVCLVVNGTVVEVLKPDQLSHAKHPMAQRYLELS